MGNRREGEDGAWLTLNLILLRNLRGELLTTKEAQRRQENITMNWHDAERFVNHSCDGGNLRSSGGKAPMACHATGTVLLALEHCPLKTPES
ncbi:hypothetical protein P8452_02860 [Trifolium repens]|nr:hypothetical protein P8452_02860 [Trifolium repens]